MSNHPCSMNYADDLCKADRRKCDLPDEWAMCRHWDDLLCEKCGEKLVMNVIDYSDMPDEVKFSKQCFCDDSLPAIIPGKEILDRGRER